MKAKKFYSYGAIVAFCLLLSSLLVAVQQAGATIYTPFVWEPKMEGWIRDADGDYIDDLMDLSQPDKRYEVVLDLNTCLSENEIYYEFDPYGTIEYIGKYVSFVAMAKVKAADLPVLASHPYVAAVEMQTEIQLTLDVANPAIKDRASGTYSPDTVEDAFPGIDGTGVNIAIIDSGVDNEGGPGTTHESLPAAKYVAGYDAVADVETDPDDDHSHGSHVAGIALGTGGAAGTFQGIAPEAGLVDIKIGTAVSVDWDDCVEGLEKAIEKRDEWGIRVVNMSLGDCVNNDGSESLAQVANTATFYGITVVVAVGNTTNCWLPDGANRVGSPGSSSRAITVAMADDHGTINRADDDIHGHSLRGPRLSDGDGDPLDELKPDVAAHGVDIHSVDYNSTSSYRDGSGTSMASPMVAGLAALIIDAKPDINPGSVKDLIIRTAEDFGGVYDPTLDPDWDVNWGHGLVDAHAALDAPVETDLGFPSHPPDPWYLSPDICVSSDGLTCTDDAELGVATNIKATVTNHSATIGAFGIRLSFGVYYFGAGFNQPFDIATQVIDVPAGATVDVVQPWTPEHEDHSCLTASIDYGLDTNFDNNEAQRNIEVAGVGGKAPTFNFRVENHYTRPLTIELIVKNDNPRWQYSISEPEPFVLDPMDCAREVDVTIYPPGGAEPGESATLDVAAFAREIEKVIGGVVMKAHMPYDCTDRDKDGFAVEGGPCGPVDCDDGDPTVSPGIPESLLAANCTDGKDNDCDGLVDTDPECTPSCAVAGAGAEAIMGFYLMAAIGLAFVGRRAFRR